MKVLLLESHPGVATEAVAELTAAGHTILSCTTPDREFPCRGLAGTDECPLDGPVDVAVLAQERGVDQLEHGAVCAARSRIPVIEIGPGRVAESGAFRRWQPGGASLTSACLEAAADGSAHARALRHGLASLGIAPGDVEVAVTREPGRVRITLYVADSLREREQDIVRFTAHLARRYDQRTSVIDVAVEGQPAGDGQPA